MVGNVSNFTNDSSGSQFKSSKMQLKTEDFIKMMITQLQNQDPMEPAKNEALLAQMSQISQLESSTQLQSSLKTLVLQNNISSAGAMIGKMVQGKDAVGEDLEGIVTSVRVEDGQLHLELDSGKKMSLSNVVSITSQASVGQAPMVAAAA
jgi:flagellar basal-body rod modification protein FlgD